MAGVIPIIFAAAVTAFPPTIASFFPSTQTFINQHFQYGSIQYLGIEFVLIVVFTYFYTAVQFNPVDQADNLRKDGRPHPGLPPRPPTAPDHPPVAPPPAPSRRLLPPLHARPPGHCIH